MCPDSAGIPDVTYDSEQRAGELIGAKSEVLKLHAQLRRTEEERDILKKTARYFAQQPSEVPVHQ